MRQIVTKSEFARLKGRTAQCVSKWISTRKITENALVGVGVRAKIDVELAEADLTRTLDPVEQGKLERPLVPSGNSAEVIDLEIIRRKRLADAERAEHEAEAARRKNAVDEGRWVDVEEATKVWGRELSQIVADFETFLTNVAARKFAEAHGLDWKATSIELRNLFRAHRTETAEEARARRDQIASPVAQAAE